MPDNPNDIEAKSWEPYEKVCTSCKDEFIPPFNARPENQTLCSRCDEREQYNRLDKADYPNDIDEHNHNEVIRLKNLCSEYRELAKTLLNKCYDKIYDEDSEYERLFYKLSPQEGSYPCEDCKEPVTTEDTCSSCGCRNEDAISIHVYRWCPYTGESLD